MASTTSQVKEICATVARWEKPPSGDSGRKRAQWIRATEEHIEAAWKKANVKEVLEERGRVIALFLHYSRTKPMVRGQKSLLFRFHPRHRKQALRWVCGKIAQNRNAYTSFTEAGGCAARTAPSKKSSPEFRPPRPDYPEVKPERHFLGDASAAKGFHENSRARVLLPYAESYGLRSP
ncbi:MAG: hypothetical protein AB7K68_13535 [Bacteriovoracia bacterium]